VPATTVWRQNIFHLKKDHNRSPICQWTDLLDTLWLSLEPQTSSPLSPQSVQKQQQLQHQEFQRQMEEKLEQLQRQQLFPTADVGMAPDSDYLEVAHTCSDHSSPNVTPRASNHSNLSVSELGSSANEHEDGGKHCEIMINCTLFGCI